MTSGSESDDEDYGSGTMSDLYGSFASIYGTTAQQEVAASTALDGDQDFEVVRPALVLWAYDEFQKWKVGVRYIAPPEHRIPPRKRVRALESEPRILLETEDPDDPGLAVLQRIDGYFHLACPFYIANPVRHRQCLLGHELKTIEDLIEHLGKHHPKPFYCPSCGQIFQSSLKRDDHMRDRLCEIRQHVNVEGVTDYQHAKLVRRDDPSQREEDRWLRVYKIVFPGANKPRRSAAYLKDGMGLTVSLIRDYWVRHGRECVKDYLYNCGLPHSNQPDKDPGVEQLQRLVLVDLIQKASRDEDTWSDDG